MSQIKDLRPPKSRNSNKVTDSELDFGQFGRRARVRTLQGKRIERGISLRSRLGRDRREIDAPLILRPKPLITRSKLAKVQLRCSRAARASKDEGGHGGRGHRSRV